MDSGCTVGRLIGCQVRGGWEAALRQRCAQPPCARTCTLEPEPRAQRMMREFSRRILVEDVSSSLSVEWWVGGGQWEERGEGR